MSGIADLEARLLASLPSIDAFQRLESLGITEEAFSTYSPMYTYIKKIVEDNNHLPRLRDLVATFNVPDHVQRKPEEYDWLLGEFLKLTTAQKVQEVLDHNVENHGDEPQAMLQSMIRDLTDLTISQGRDISITDMSFSTRLDSYAGRYQRDGMIVGCPTGLNFFDANARIGWMPGELIGMVARTFVGKSWFLLYFGLIAWNAGRRILFLSPELPEDETEARWDTLLCGMNDVVVDNQDFYRGFRPSPEQVELAKKSANRSDWITLSSVDGRPFSMQELPRLVRYHRPNILLIDGLSFIKLGRNIPLWERIQEVSHTLKTLAISEEIVIIVSHQANRGAHNIARPPGLHEVAGGDGFAQACDRMLVLSKPNRPKEIVLTVQKFRKGEPEQGGIHLFFDPGKGKIYETANPGAARKSGDSGPGLQDGNGDANDLPIP